MKRNYRQPTADLFNWIKTALEIGKTIDDIYQITKISKWFLHQLEDIVRFETQLKSEAISETNLREAKKIGLSNLQLSLLLEKTEKEIEQVLIDFNIKPTFKMVDTCAAEFEAKTPYYFKTYEQAQ